MLTPNPYLGDRIAAYRERSGLKQYELARLVGTMPKYISTLEKGMRKPRPIMLARIAAALGVSMDELNRKERYQWK